MATLSIKVDPSGAIGPAREIKRTLEEMGDAAEGAEKKVDRVRDAFGRFTKAGNDAAGGARVFKRSADDMNRAVGEAGRGVIRFTSSANDNFARLNQTVTGVTGTFRTLAAVLGPLAGLFSASAIIGFADAWSDMQSRVGAAIKDMEAAPAMMKRLVDIANASYAPLSQTVEIYSRNVSVLRDLGRGAAEAADFTESLNHMLVITATRGERAASVQNALSKAMATGKLASDGLETVLANGGRVAEALAKTLGTNVNGLRAMATQGKITGDVITRALIGSLEKVRKEAAEMPATVSDGFTRIGTNLTALVGQFDQATGASGLFAAALIALADNLGAVAYIIGALALGHLASLIVSVGSEFLLLATRANAANAALTLLSGTMRLMGGPVGFVFATMAMYIGYMETRTTETDRATQALRDSVAELDEAYTGPQSKLDGMLESTRELAKLNVKTALEAAEKQMAELERRFKASHLDEFNLGRSVFQNTELSALVAQLQEGRIAVSDYIGEVMKLGSANPELEEFARVLGHGNSEIVDLAQEIANTRARMDELAGAANGAAGGIRNSGNAAAAAAGQYATAGAAAAGYAANLRALGALIPAVAAAQQAQERMGEAEKAHTAMTAASRVELANRTLTLDQFAARQQQANEMLAQARAEVTGLASVERDLASVTQNNVIGALDGQARAIAQVRAEYAQRNDAIRQSIQFGADEAQAEALLAKNASELEKALANVNTQFEKKATSGKKAGGGASAAAKGLKEAAKAAEDLVSKADGLAEKMFPAEYARREAEELLSLLNQFGGQLDELQRKAVEAEIADLFKASALGLRNLSDEAKKAGKEMENAFEPLASLLGDLFSGPIEDLDELVDKVMGAFAQIGQANLKKLTDGLFGKSGEGTEAQAVNQLGKSIGKAAAPALAETVAPAAGEGVFAGLQSFLGGQGGAMLSAGIGGFGMGYQTQSPAMGALGGALQGAGAGMAFGPVGMIAGALIGGLAGAIGGIFGKSKAQREAKKELMKQQGSIDNLLAIGEGTGVGTYTAQLREYKDENEKAQELAAKAGDVDLQRRLQAAYNTYFTRTFEDFNRNFDGLAKSLNDGLGANSPFMQAATEVTELRESLLGFIADARDMNEQHIKLAGLEEGDPAFEVMEQQIERMTAGARAMALAALSGAEEYTEIEAAVERAHGAVAGLQNTLELLGMSAEEAARAIDSHLNIAMAKMRDAYRDELNASINDKSGFGFINEIVDAHKLYEDRLRDATKLGLDGSLAMKELNLSLKNIVSSSSLTQAEIDMLAAAWPAMAGLIEAVAGKDAMAMVAEAESALRAAYEKQKSEIETTISRLERFTDTIKRFREEMRVNASSPLSQKEQMEEALKLYRETAAAAMSGDQEAQEKLTSVSQSALDEARAYYASSEEYAKIWREIDTTLELVERSAGRQLSEAQQQLEALNKQVGALIDINESVLSVEEAIAALANATSARDRQMQEQINAAKNSGVESKNAQIAEMYRSILGREGRADEIDWWANKSGKSIAQIRADIEWQKNVLGSFQTGGYTGNMGVSDIAGFVHGQEFVMPAAQTKAYLPDLSAMYAGTYRAGNDNGALIAAIGRLERRLEEQNSEMKSLRATVAAGAQQTISAVKEGNAELGEVADQLKRANSR